MIRIIDEPIYEMTSEEYSRLIKEFTEAEERGLIPWGSVFEWWLENVKNYPSVPRGRMSV